MLPVPPVMMTFMVSPYFFFNAKAQRGKGAKINLFFLFTDYFLLFTILFRPGRRRREWSGLR